MRVASYHHLQLSGVLLITKVAGYLHSYSGESAVISGKLPRLELDYLRQVDGAT